MLNRDSGIKRATNSLGAVDPKLFLRRYRTSPSNKRQASRVGAYAQEQVPSPTVDELERDAPFSAFSGLSLL